MIKNAVVAIASIFVVAFFAGCKDDSSSSYDPFADVEGDGRGVIGPDGGVVEVTDPENPIAGVKVTVPAGAWKERWVVDITYRSIFGTEDYDDGYVPFERPNASGSLTIGLSGKKPLPSEPMYMEISFPLAKLSGKGSLLSAFYYDSDGDWRVRLPDRITATHLVIKGDKNHVRWSWGRIDFEEIDFEKEVSPAMDERHGADTMAELRAKWQEELGKQQLVNDCLKLKIAQAAFSGFRDAAGNGLDGLQAAIECGVCDLKSEQFYEDLVEYIKLYIEGQIVQLIAGELPGILGLIAEMVVAGIYEAMMKSFDCDYECFFETPPPVLLLLLEYAGIYWGSYAAVWGIDNYMEFKGCP